MLVCVSKASTWRPKRALIGGNEQWSAQASTHRKIGALTSQNEDRLAQTSTQIFVIYIESSAFRNARSAWMDNACKQGEWNEALIQVGVVAMENLRSCVATEDLKVNARDLFNATATPSSDKLGEAISTLAKEAEKRGRSRGRGRQDGHGYGRSNHNNNSNGNNNNNNTNNNAGRGRGQGNFRGPAQQ